MQTTIPTEKTDRVFEIEIYGKKIPCAEAHIKRALFDDAHKEINAFYTRLCKEFLTYAEKHLAPEFAARLESAQTVKERCSLKKPVLTLEILPLSVNGENGTVSVRTAYTLSHGARAAKKGENITEWDAAMGVMVKRRADRRRST